jgi:hypothetical protein
MPVWGHESFVVPGVVARISAITNKGNGREESHTKRLRKTQTL